MENKFYPLRVSVKGYAIVSDTFPAEARPGYSEADKKYEYDAYGGYLIAESLPPEIAKQMVEAYNKMYGQKDLTHHSLRMKGSFLIGRIKSHEDEFVLAEFASAEFGQKMIDAYHMFGCTHDDGADQDKKMDASSEDYMDINSNPGTKVTVSEQSFRNGSDTYKDRAAKHLKIGGVYTVTRTDIHNWYTEVYVDEFPGVPFSSVQFVKVNDVGSLTPTIKVPLEFIQNIPMGESRKHGDNLITKLTHGCVLHDKKGYEYMEHMSYGKGDPQYDSVVFKIVETANNNSTAYKNVDVVKVIEDLISVATEWGWKDCQKHPSIQNAEAALGMLQAFRTPIEEVFDDGVSKKHPLTEKEAFKYEDYKSLMGILSDVKGRYEIADAIIFALKNFKP
jgi:hypothetical protein